ncbi:hypothetical protein NQ318_023280 [Aromia moschata]|uniref:Helicase ATP-binding domain-containing protein n=1 Tax=Aromia moschata TaxID=1265417 RepID=A0AAV8Y5R2_9CUCU|nr:hypothetical protein NQ318_023280 [Aromia moschata]
MSLDDFPMEKYIIHAEKVAKPPKYLNETVSYDVDGAKLYPLFWPDGASHYGLNDSQQAAFRAALTQEIAVIQGPPGTGKTFIGLKIAQTLLKNRTIWHERGPILVICYTNHALDQFLEGIMPFTKDLLRIGGRSKNENLNKYNLRNSKVQRKSEAFYQIYRELKICLGKLKSIDNEFENILNYDGIIDFSSFDVLPHYRNSPFRHIAKEDITSWLLAEVNGDGEETDTMLPTLNVALPMISKTVPKSSKTDSDDEINSEFDDREQEADIIEIEGDVANLVPLITLREIQLKIYQLKCKLEEFIQTPLGVIRESLEGDNIRERLFQLYQTYDYLQNLVRVDFRIHLYRKNVLENFLMRLRNLNKYRHCSNPDMDPRLMNPDDRWALYSMWLQQYLQYLGRKRKQKKYKIYSEQRDIEDVKIMRENLVVGMTTTGAARLRASLEALRSPIVIVEEAAEVLESHIVTALTVRCQHLILIGDHKQLKPSTANYKIATQYGLEVSLFERMVNNDLQCYTLDVQHRMKPKICNLIRPTIYPHLLDHTSVMRRPSIQGVVPDLFFIDHKYPEELCDNSSKKNIHEAKYLINLAKYLILNGYESDNITILAAYLGQMFEMQRERKKNDMLLANVRIAVLDNYQGEESDIILLSLVRNNSDNKIGFLKIENRVCVALSRARNGLYIMGNMDMLCNNSSLWRDVKKTLEAENALGKSLELRCSIHDTITEVECEDDFAKVPEGGCTLKCGTELSCGHICNNVCHIQDRDHNIYKCYEHCGRRLCDKTETHICKKKCFEECGPCDYPVTHMLPCGHEATIPCHIDPLDHKCSTLVSTTLECNHVANRPCYIPTEDFPCPHPCDNRVEQCGHACTRLCHVKDDPDHLQYKCQKPCVKSRLGCTSLKEPHVCRRRCFEECEPCTVDVKKKRTLCPHVYKVPCNSDVDEIVCEKPCKTLLPCNHICKKKCFETCGPCSIKVEKNIPACGHKTKLSCFETPERKHCNKQCNQTLPCGHGCTNKCSQPCTAKCLHMKDCDLMSPCGHNVKKISCYENCNNYDLILLKYCTAPCGVKLKCDHICKGTCGACFQGRIHQRCGEKCGVYLVCNHECPIPCREACKPCEKNCTYRCDHSVCKKKCGEICVKCAEQCPRKCVHQACKKKCGDICSVGPCEEPCPKSLQCGHPCIGFCNDRCPRKCRICDNDEVSEIFFGTEDDEDARFVELQDCKHILESTGMENWLNQGDEIQMKVCPKCKASVVNTQRYSDYVKRAIIDINNIKQRLIGSHKQNEERRERLLEQVAFIQEKSNKLLGMTHLRNSIKKIEGRLQSSKQVSLKSGKSNRVKQPIDGIVLQALTSKIQLLRYLLDVCCMPENIFMSPEMKAQITFILDTLVRDEDQITVQEIEDIELEINRLRRIVEIHPRLLPKYATDTVTVWV